MNFHQILLFIRRFRYELIAVIFTAYGLYLRFICLLNRDFWADELYSVQFLQGAFKPFWQRLFYTGLIYFPGDYIINWPFAVIFKENKWGLAIPHILFTILGFYFLYLICKRYFTSIFAWIATFALMAIHRDLIFHSFELRPYAVLPTLALGVFYFSEQIISNTYNLSRLRKILIGLFFIFTIVYHAYGIIILFCVFTYFFLCELKKRHIREIIKRNYRFLSLIALIGMPLFLWYSVGTPALIVGVGYNVFEYIPNPAVNLLGFIKTVLCCLAGSKILYFLAIFLIFPFILPLRLRLQQICFLFVLVILPVLCLLYTSFAAKYWFIQRQFIWVMPFFAFLTGWCIDSFCEFIRRKIKISC